MSKLSFFIFILVLIVSLHAYSQDHQREPLGNIETFIDRFDEKNVVKNRNGWYHYYIPKGMADTLTVKMSCVFEGTQTHLPHTHNEDEAFYIVKGPVIFHINNVEKILNTGDLIYTPSGSYHNIQRPTSDTIKYLVIKRECLTRVDKPFQVEKNNYTFDDCHNPVENYKKTINKEFILLDKKFADGLQIIMNQLSKDDSISNHNNQLLQQIAIYIIEGEAEVSLNGQKAIIKNDNTFYCPKKARYSLKNTGKEPLIFLSITTP